MEIIVYVTKECEFNINIVCDFNKNHLTPNGPVPKWSCAELNRIVVDACKARLKETLIRLPVTIKVV